MSMAYLLGSAYLEWLEERAGPGSLRNLWARMTARTPRELRQTPSAASSATRPPTSTTASGPS